MERIISSGVIEVSISYQMPVFLIKKKQKSKSNKEKIKGRSHVNYDKQKFQDDIKDHPGWKHFWDIDENNPVEIWDSLENIIKDTANSHCPFKDITVRKDTPT